MKDSTEIYPYPSEWMDDDRFSVVRAKLIKNYELYKAVGVHKALIKYLVRKEVSNEALSNEEIWQSDNIEDDLKNSLPDDEKPLTDEQKFAMKIALGCKRWSEYYWGKEVFSLYLEQKSSLDQVSLRMIKVSSKNLVNELYHQITNKEKTFDQIHDQYSEQILGAQRGLFPLQPINKLPYGLDKASEVLVLNKISSPMRLGKKFIILELLDKKTTKFSPEISSVLLSKRFDEWVDNIVWYAAERFEAL